MSKNSEIKVNKRSNSSGQKSSTSAQKTKKCLTLKSTLRLTTSPSLNRFTNAHVQFDESNIDDTRNFLKKDYGLMAIPESNTPYPHVEHLNAQTLSGKLAKLNKEFENSDESSSESLSNLESQPFWIYHLNRETTKSKHYKSALFLRKRQQFEAAEFTIASQLKMSEIPHPIGVSHDFLLNSVQSAKFMNQNALIVPSIESSVYNEEI